MTGETTKAVARSWAGEEPPEHRPGPGEEGVHRLPGFREWGDATETGPCGFAVAAAGIGSDPGRECRCLLGVRVIVDDGLPGSRSPQPETPEGSTGEQHP